jgi:hypothetical protein
MIQRLEGREVAETEERASDSPIRPRHGEHPVTFTGELVGAHPQCGGGRALGEPFIDR